MEYRVAELAEAAGVGVDTIRFYQTRGLIPAPERRGRFAIYSSDHLGQIRRIRGLLDGGFSLAQIRRLLEGEDVGPASDADTQGAGAPEAPEDRALLQALADQSVGAGTMSLAELAAETGMPEALVSSVAGALARLGATLGGSCGILG